MLPAVYSTSTHNIHTNLLITLFIITVLDIILFKDKKNVKIKQKNDHIWSFFYIICTFLFGYNTSVY